MKKQKYIADGDEASNCLTVQIAEQVRKEMQRDDDQMCECGFTNKRCLWPACGTLGKNI